MAQELKVMQDFYDFTLWLIGHTEKFPRHMLSRVESAPLGLLLCLSTELILRLVKKVLMKIKRNAAT